MEVEEIDFTNLEPEGGVEALMLIPPADIQTTFATPNALNPILDRIETYVRSQPTDITTVKGRKAIGSLAMKVARSKTYLDGVGKELVAGLKELPKRIDANRAAMRDRLDTLKDEVRKPLTDWEAEQERIKLAAEVEAAHEIALLMDAEFDRQKQIERVAAEVARTVETLRIAAEAKANAMREAQEQIDRANREKAEAETRAIQAQADAERKAEEARVQAVKSEQERVARELQKINAERHAREADIEHKRAVNVEAVEDLVTHCSLSQEQAQMVVSAIVRGNIRHVGLSY